MKRLMAAIFGASLLVSVPYWTGDAQGATAAQPAAEQAGAAAAQKPAKPQSKSEQAGRKAVRKGVTREAEKKLAAKRSQLIKEAVAALQETKDALALLDKGDGKGALAKLTDVLGKLDIVVAREPELAYAPVEVRATSIDLLTSVDKVRELRKQIEGYFKEGKLQLARHALQPFASEIIVSIVELPLATYQEGIRFAVFLIDEGKLAEAKQVLATTLDSLVVEDHVIPLPLLRAELLLDHARELVVKTGRSKEESDVVRTFLQDAKRQLDLAEALTYVDTKTRDTLSGQIDEIAADFERGKDVSGAIQKLVEKLRELRRTIFA